MAGNDMALTASQSVDRILASADFHEAAEQYWSHAPLPKDRPKALRELRVFTEAEIRDTSVAGHRRIKDELQDIFNQIETWRLSRDWKYNEPERANILGLLNLETVLLEAAEIAEDE